MSHYLFQQLKFVRKATIEYVKGVNENRFEVVPAGLNNNIIWNLGHIYMVTEKFVFQLTGEKITVPNHFPELFDPGTSPKDWSIDTPTIEELIVLLNEQMERIEAILSERIEELLKGIYNSSTGLQISSVAECLSFCLYHEGMHFGAIKGINQ
ncbi:DinB family protein [Gracilibacillus caseinilyticus]|uniref:DinB family protein n=1 Tax=Gracilibacillus caseinilyticus TaxID=2932256 RepID=A0ABY4EZ83_9BACI|nr:DinB family protein [Gracilibacillus caseinilyticus]UOQ49321.1 DinB family protein [Gracilibacillus caseinilyticus]